MILKNSKILVFFSLFCLILIACIDCQYRRIYQSEQEERNQIEDIIKNHTIVNENNNCDVIPIISRSDSAPDVKDNTNNHGTMDNTEAYDCIIQIPAIDLEKFVYTGTQREKYLDEYKLVTASDDMEYRNGGNYIICGHASRLYGHSLNRLKELKAGDKIYIKTAKQSDEYIIKAVSFENRNNTKDYYVQNTKPLITIVSCAKYISSESYIIIQAVKSYNE